MIKTILTFVSNQASSALCVASSAYIAEQFSAHVEIIHAKPDPATMVPVIGEGMAAGMVDEVLRMAEDQTNDAAAKVTSMVQSSIARVGIPQCHTPEAAPMPSINFEIHIGREDELAGQLGRLSDLIVLPFEQNSVDGSCEQTLNGALMDAGKPVLVMPSSMSTPPESIGDHIVIAWNGSAESSRAVSQALPFLRRAKSVAAIMIEDGEQAVTGEDLQNYLAWHGIQAKLDVFGHRGEKAGKIILDHAKAQNADMIVMGAYTHSRLRQMIFGGVTSHILAHGTCPVLFAH